MALQNTVIYRFTTFLNLTFLRPSVVHNEFLPVEHNGITCHETMIVNPNQFRWSPSEFPHSSSIDFLDGLSLVCGSGDTSSKSGLNIYIYAATSSMINKAMYNSDGDFLIVPQEGTLTIKTELGILVVEPCEIAVIQRGIKFSVAQECNSRGYVLEVFNGHFSIPDLGPIGANGLANPNDFLVPEAFYENLDFPDGGYSIYNKFCGKVFCATQNYSPFNCVAWHGNYAPYKYDLRKFCTMNTVSYDHAVRYQYLPHTSTRHDVTRHEMTWLVCCYQ
jgi:homogentisate 1,2-dioxygenase